MKSVLVLTIIVCLLAGSVSSYGLSYMTYEPRIKDYEIQTAVLTSEVSRLNSTVSSQEALILTLKLNLTEAETKISTLQTELTEEEAKVSDLNSQISSFETEIIDLQTDLSKAESQISNYEEQISSLELEKSKLQSDLAEAQSMIASYETQITTLESQISTLQSQATGSQAKIATLQSQLSSLQSQVNSYKTQVSTLQSRLSRILDITVTQHYEWVYGTWLWSERYEWDLPIPLSLYVEYLERPRPTSWKDWVNMAKDPKDDRYVDQLVYQINSVAIKEGFTEAEKVNFLIAFVQSLPYTEDSVTTPWNEYPRYPIETLFDRGGDCEDTSILVASLLDRMGYDVALLFLKYERHVAVGVSIAGVYGSYYEYDGKKYFYLETTGEGWEIGEIPSAFTDTRAYIYPLYL